MSGVTAGAFTGFFQLTFDASALDSQRGSTAINGCGPTHLSKPIIIDSGYLGYIHRADKAFNLTPIEQTAGKKHYVAIVSIKSGC